MKAAAISAVLLFSSIAYIRRRFYEIFQKLYLILVAVLIAAIYLYSVLKDLWKALIVYLFAVICL